MPALATALAVACKATEPATSASIPIGGEGGTLALPTGGQLTIPPGALSDQRSLTARRAPEPPPEQLRSAGPLIEFGPSGTVFRREATLVIPYGQQDPTGLVLGELTPGRSFVRVVPTRVDPSTRTVSGPVDHFSLWGVWLPAAYLTPLRGTVTYRVNGCPSRLTDGTTCKHFVDDVRRAFAYWNKVLADVVFLEAGTPGAGQIGIEITLQSFLATKINWILPHDYEKSAVSGFKSGAESIRSIWLNDDDEWTPIEGLRDGVKSDNVFRTVLHELGHQLGLQHTDPIEGPPYEVMSYTFYGYPLGVTCTELTRLAALGYSVRRQYARCDAAATVAGWPATLQGTIGQPASVEPTVVVKNKDGTAVEGAFVLFRASSGNGSVASWLVETNEEGEATPGAWVFGATAGQQELSAYVPGLEGSKTFFFSADVRDIGGGIRGSVNDILTGASLGDVRVELRDSRSSPSSPPIATQNVSGEFAFARVPPGNYIVSATAPGYRPGQTLAIAVGASVEVAPTLRLARAPTGAVAPDLAAWHYGLDVGGIDMCGEAFQGFMNCFGSVKDVGPVPFPTDYPLEGVNSSGGHVRVQYLLSCDANPSADDRVAGAGALALPNPYPDALTSGLEAPDGEYYVIYVVNPGFSFETNTSNNYIVQRVSIHQGNANRLDCALLPDLTAQLLSPPTKVVVGSQVALSYEVASAGASAKAGIILSLQLCPAPRGNDVGCLPVLGPLTSQYGSRGTFATSAAIATNGSYRGSVPVRIISGTAGVDYYWRLEVNTLFAIPEASTTNNVTFSQSPVRVCASAALCP